MSPPGPVARYPGQFLYSMATDRLGLFAEMARRGDVTQLRLGHRRVALLSHPEDIRRLLVTERRAFSRGDAERGARALLGDGLLASDGEAHARRRRLVQSAFGRERLAGYAAVVAERAARATGAWRDDTVIDVHGEMMRLTLAIAGRTLLGVDVERDCGQVAEALRLALRMPDQSLFPFGTVMGRAPSWRVRDPGRARARMSLVIHRLIAERRATGVDHGDVLSALVAARHADGDGAKLTDHQLRDEIVSLLVAGHETTANALTWALYLLTRHPEQARALRQEADGVLGDRAPTMEDLPRLRQARAVLAETLRLNPPRWVVRRVALEDFEAGGYVIERGTTVCASQYLVHRDRRWWTDAERFAPARWLGDDQPSRPAMAYFPFGGGAHGCLGEQLAWMQGTLVLAAIARRWRLRYAGWHPPAPEPLASLRPKGGLLMGLSRRRH